MACRQAAALFDETSFSKLDISGPMRPPSWSACAPPGGEGPGSFHLHATAEPTRWRRVHLTVTRLGRRPVPIITGTAFGLHDMVWIARMWPRRSRCRSDVTSHYGCLALWGPRPGPSSRRSPTPTCRPADSRIYGPARSTWAPCPAGPAGDVRGRAGRECTARPSSRRPLGHEIVHPPVVPTAFSGRYRASSRCGLQKGYRICGIDVTPSDTLRAGLGSPWRFDKGSSSGRTPRRRPQKPVAAIVVCLVLHDLGRRSLGRSLVSVDGPLRGAGPRAGVTATAWAAPSPIAVSPRPDGTVPVAPWSRSSIFGRFVGQSVGRAAVRSVGRAHPG